MRSFSRLFSLSLLLAGTFAAGCSAPSESDTLAQDQRGLAQLPDCAAVDVAPSFEADATALDDVYIVRVHEADVCTASFDGLQALSARIDTTGRPGPTLDTAASNPMPGQGDAASNPMPGQGDAASNPMPGSTGDASSNPMPGSTGDASSNPMPGSTGVSNNRRYHMTVAAR